MPLRDGVKKHRGLHPLRMPVDPWCPNSRRLTKPRYPDLGPKVAGQRLCLLQLKGRESLVKLGTANCNIGAVNAYLNDLRIGKNNEP